MQLHWISSSNKRCCLIRNSGYLGLVSTYGRHCIPRPASGILHTQTRESLRFAMVYMGVELLEISIDHCDFLVQYCSNSIANALELLQSCTKPSICLSWWWKLSYRRRQLEKCLPFLQCARRHWWRWWCWGWRWRYRRPSLRPGNAPVLHRKVLI